VRFFMFFKRAHELKKFEKHCIRRIKKKLWLTWAWWYLHVIQHSEGRGGRIISSRPAWATY
jgi:hypothetical protein